MISNGRHSFAVALNKGYTMKIYYRVYLLSLAISFSFILLPWLLEGIGVISSRYTFFPSAPIGAVLAILFSSLFIISKATAWKPRVTLIMLNPGLYYLIILVIMLLALSREKFNGWESLIP